jgi:hypothetical protein
LCFLSPESRAFSQAAGLSVFLNQNDRHDGERHHHRHHDYLGGDQSDKDDGTDIGMKSSALKYRSDLFGIFIFKRLVTGDEAGTQAFGFGGREAMPLEQVFPGILHLLLHVASHRDGFLP